MHLPVWRLFPKNGQETSRFTQCVHNLLYLRRSPHTRSVTTETVQLLRQPRRPHYPLTQPAPSGRWCQPRAILHGQFCTPICPNFKLTLRLYLHDFSRFPCYIVDSLCLTLLYPLVIPGLQRYNIHTDVCNKNDGYFSSVPFFSCVFSYVTYGLGTNKMGLSSLHTASVTSDPILTYSKKRLSVYGEEPVRLNSTNDTVLHRNPVG